MSDVRNTDMIVFI